MTADQYVQSVLNKYQVQRGPASPAEQFGSAVAGPLRTWANQYLNELRYSGSYAKETGVHGISDVDILVSLNANTPGTLKDIYNELYTFASGQRWSPRMQNVSIGVTVNGTQGDLVPGRIQTAYQNYHSLYVRKRDTWTQTNVALHIDTVRNSRRVSEIRAVKIWRYLNGFDIPSLYLELFVIDALSGRSTANLAENVLHVLRAITSSLSTTRILDPANTNNVLSDDLTKSEKDWISGVARQSASQQNWGQIIW